MDRRTTWEKVFWTQDVGEQGFIQTLMQHEGIPCRPADEFAERYSLWTNYFFRTFSLSVPTPFVGRARRLIRKHENIKPDRPLSPLHRYLACVILLIFATGLLIGIVEPFFR